MSSLAPEVAAVERALAQERLLRRVCLALLAVGMTFLLCLGGAP